MLTCVVRILLDVFDVLVLFGQFDFVVGLILCGLCVECVVCVVLLYSLCVFYLLF